MKRQIFLAVGMVFVVFAPCVWGSPQPGDANSLHTLQDYLRFAALNNAQLKARFHEWKAAVEQVPQAKSLPDPKFTYGYFIEEVETRVGPQQQRVGLMQVFPWFGKIEARTDAAAASAKAAKKRYEAEKLKLFYQVKELFAEYAYLARAVEIAGQNLDLLRHFEEVARTRYMAAAGTHPDVIRAQVELATLEDVLKSLEELRQPMSAKLNAALNRPSLEVLPWPQQEPFTQMQIAPEQMTAILVKTNPELAELGHNVEAAKYRVELAKKKFWPDIGVGVDWIGTDEAPMSGVRGSGRDPVVLMFSMNLPIWRDNYKAAERQAMAKLRQISHQKVELENRLLAQAQKTLYDLQDSNRKISLYRDSLLPKAEELLQASELAYQGGTVDFLSLIDAQRTLLKFELQ
ncbi:MAG: TolC family protein, partial [Planctomycetota bacterium]